MYVESQSGVAIMDPSNRFYRDPKFRFVPIEGEGARMSFNAAWRKDNQNPAIALFDSVISRLPGEEERGVMGTAGNRAVKEPADGVEAAPIWKMGQAGRMLPPISGGPVSREKGCG